MILFVHFTKARTTWYRNCPMPTTATTLVSKLLWRNYQQVRIQLVYCFCSSFKFSVAIELRPKVLSLFLSGLVQTNEELRKSSLEYSSGNVDRNSIVRNISSSSIGSASRRQFLSTTGLSSPKFGVLEKRGEYDVSIFFQAT